MSEGIKSDPLWEKCILGRGHTAYKSMQFRAQCGAHLSEEVNLVSLSMFLTMKGNLFSFVIKKVWRGFQAQLDSNDDISLLSHLLVSSVVASL